MNITEALRYIATQASVSAYAVRRATFPAGMLVRHATREEQATLHAYVQAVGTTVVAFDASAEDMAADDWEVVRPDGKPIPQTPQAKGETKPEPATAPQTPQAKGAAR